MKKFIIRLLSIPLFFGLLWVFPYLIKFATWIIEIDNAEFGFPWWLDLLIDSIAGSIAFCFTGCLFDLFGNYDKGFMSQTKNIIGIIVGFIIGVFVHAILQYWYIIISIMVLAIIGIVVFYKMKCKKKNKVEREVK